MPLIIHPRQAPGPFISRQARMPNAPHKQPGIHCLGFNLLTVTVAGAGFQYVLGGISPAKPGDAPFYHNPISPFVEPNLHGDKEKVEEFQARIAIGHFAPDDYTRGFASTDEGFPERIAIGDSLSLTVRVRGKTPGVFTGGEMGA